MFIVDMKVIFRWAQISSSRTDISLSVAESFKMMNRLWLIRPNLTVTLFDALFFGNYKRLGSNVGNFHQFFHHYFQPKWKEFWWFQRNDLIQIYQNITYFKFKTYFFIYKNTFLGEKSKNVGFFFAAVFFSKYFQSLVVL